MVRRMTCLMVAAALSGGLLGAAEHSPGDKFVIAIEGANLAAVKALVEEGASPDTPVEYGEHKTTPLHKAAWNGRRDIAKYLLSKGATVDGRDTDGQTPLLQAVTRGFDDVVDVLLAAGADAKAADSRGNTPFSAAMFGGHYDIAEVLLKAGADPNAAFTAGITPLMGASSICNVESIRFLVKAGAKVDKVSQLEYGGSTALTTAVSVGQTDCVRELLEQGASPTLKMKDGSTAISKAKEAGNQEVVALLEAAAAAAAAKARPKAGVTAKATAKKP
jgi:ankyrin repeat protein